MAELSAWLGGLGDYPLPTYTGAVWEFLAGGGEGGRQSSYEARLVVPSDLSGSETKTVVSKGWPFLCNGSIAIGEFEELKQITAMLSDLNTNLALSLDVSPSFARTPTITASTGDRGIPNRYVVLGASHGRRIATALSNSGYEVTDLTDGGWKLSTTGVARLVEKFENVKPNLHADTQVVLSVLDSSLFWGETEEGAAPARKAMDNRFHLEGRVKLAGRDVVADRFNMLLPLLLAAAKFKTTLLSPLPRYLTGGCCANEEHCTNRMEDGYAAQQLRDLERTRQTLRDCVFRCKNKSVKVMNPVKLFGGERDTSDVVVALKAIWGGDPVHPTQGVYQRVAEEMAAELGRLTDNKGGRGVKRGRSPDQGGVWHRGERTGETSGGRMGMGRPFSNHGSAHQSKRGGSSGRGYTATDNARGRGGHNGDRRGGYLGGNRGVPRGGPRGGRRGGFKGSRGHGWYGR